MFTNFRILIIIILSIFFSISCSQQKQPYTENKSLTSNKDPYFIEKNIISFRFNSSESGILNFRGKCLSSSRKIINGIHEINFFLMVEGVYDNCYIQLINKEGKEISRLIIPKFIVDFTPPELILSSDVFVKGKYAKFDLMTDEMGELSNSGECNMDRIYLEKGKSEVTVLFPGNGQYNDCELYITDAAGNISKPLSLGIIRIDVTVPALTEINPVPEKIQTDRPSYSFKTSKSGILSFSGKCKGNVDKAVVGINHISLLTGEPGTYDDCSLTLTDSSNNISLPLKISPFKVLNNS